MFTAPFFRTILAAGVVLAISINAFAQVPSTELKQTETPEQRVQIVGVRDPAFMPYKTAYELLSKVSAASNGKVLAVIRVTSATTHAPVEGLRVTLQGDNTFENLNVSPEGFVTIPLSKTVYEDHADFLTNQKKGSIRVGLFLVPELPAQGFSYAEAVQGIASAREALSQVLPWYVRLVIPSIKYVGVCYPDKGQAVAISHSAEGQRQAISEETDMTTEAKVYCSKFSLDEKDMPQDSVITPAAGWKPLFL